MEDNPKNLKSTSTTINSTNNSLMIKINPYLIQSNPPHPNPQSLFNLLPPPAPSETSGSKRKEIEKNLHTTTSKSTLWPLLDAIWKYDTWEGKGMHPQRLFKCGLCFKDKKYILNNFYNWLSGNVIAPTTASSWLWWRNTICSKYMRNTMRMSSGGLSNIWRSRWCNCFGSWMTSE